MEANNTKKFIYIVLALVAILIIFVLVRNSKKEKEVTYDISMAPVESVDVLMKESFPVQVDLLVKGYLPDPCTELGNIREQLVGNVFNVSLEMRKQKHTDLMCAQVIEPYETTIPLTKVLGISAGEYTVNVNGFETKFTMDVDNFVSDFDPLK